MPVWLIVVIGCVVYAVFAAAFMGISVALYPTYDLTRRPDDKPAFITGLFWPLVIPIWLWKRLVEFFHWLTLWVHDAQYRVGYPIEIDPEVDIQYADTGWIPPEEKAAQAPFHPEDHVPVIQGVIGDGLQANLVAAGI